MNNQNSIDPVSFSVTAYSGFEDEVLNLRNRNRAKPRTREYLDWRYLGQKTIIPPVIFWVYSDKRPVGMAGLIFRPYWINGEIKYIGVLGDISLDSELRGKGIAKDFFIFINSYLNDNSTSFAFVIPNIPAQKTLSSAGWQIQEKLIRHIFMLNPCEKLLSIIKIKSLSNLISVIYKTLIGLKIRYKAKGNYKMEFVNKLDHSFDTFWNNIRKDKLILNDRSASTLTWRYLDHPYSRCRVVKFIAAGNFIAYLIYYIREDRKECIIYDILSNHDTNIEAIIWEFLMYVKKNVEVDMVNLVINQKNRYAAHLGNMGFSKRKGENLFQIYKIVPPDDTAQNDWYITLGDKDV